MNDSQTEEIEVKASLLEWRCLVVGKNNLRNLEKKPFQYLLFRRREREEREERREKRERIEEEMRKMIPQY